MSPGDTAAALAAIKIIRNEPQRRKQLWRNIKFLKEELSELKLFPSESAILCLGLENATQALQISTRLKEAGIFAPAIRPPTVPTSRLRLSVMATHETSHLQQLLQILYLILKDCIVLT